MPKKSKKRVGLLLDETGSMSARKDEVIVAVNNYFKTLREEKAKVTFATFDTAQGTRFREINTPAKQLPNLTTESYKPNSMTNLYDSVGRMIAEMDTYAKPEDKVLVTIVTDGEENSSQELDNAAIKEMIQKKENEGWVFAYIGASPAAWTGGSAMGMGAGVVLNVAGNQMVNAMKTHASATRMYMSGDSSKDDFYDKSRHLVDDDDA